MIIFKSYSDPLEESLNKTTTQLHEASEENHFSNLFDGIISMHMMAYNEFGIVIDQFEATNYSQLAKVFFYVYMVLVSILLVNMLIAMLGKTYQDIASQPNENLRQWARALLTVERMWTKQQRLQVLDRYARLDAISGDRYYGFTWPLKVSFNAGGRGRGLGCGQSLFVRSFNQFSRAAVGHWTRARRHCNISVIVLLLLHSVLLSLACRFEICYYIS